MNRFYVSGIVVAACALLLGACSPVTFGTIRDTIIYDPEFNTKMVPGNGVTQFEVRGKRDYQDLHDARQTHTFNMDDQKDKFTLIIYDEDGVLPGSSFAYNVQAVDPRTLVALWLDTPTTAVPTSYGQRVKRFKFIYSLAPSKAPVFNNDEMTVELQYSPVAASNASAFVGGLYQFTTIQASGRYITFDLKFDLADALQYIDPYPLAEQSPP